MGNDPSGLRKRKRRSCHVAYPAAIVLDAVTASVKLIRGGRVACKR